MDNHVLCEVSMRTLKVDSDVIPDTIALKTGWVVPENVVPKWSSIFCNGFANYLKILGPDLINRLDRE